MYERITFYCEDCQQPIEKDALIVIKVDNALDADDGYGDDHEIYICSQCANDENH